MSDAAYRDSLAHLFGLRRFGMRPGLEVMRALLAELGHPERSFRAIHVAGSKGKGSVAAIATAALGATGERVGRFTSPHLQSYRERIQAGGVMIPKTAVVAGIEKVRRLEASLAERGAIDREATFFEVTTALAFDWFHTEGVRWAVIEVGLGGRLDSTNVVDAPVGVISTIELEHEEILGPAISDIAAEKAGILHPGMRAIVGALPAEAMRVVEGAARTLGVPLWRLGQEILVGERTLSPSGQRFQLSTPSRSLARVDLPLLGSFQPGNAALAVAAVDAFLHAVGGKVSDAAVRRGIAAVRWRGRLERVAEHPELYLDVAHTPESASAVAESLAEISPFEDPTENVVLFGCLAGKKAEEILDRLSPLAQTIVLTPVRSERSARVDDLRRAAQGRFPRIVVAPSSADGLRLARAATGEDGFTLAVGSDYLVGELLDTLEGAPSGEPDLSDPVGAGPSAGRPSARGRS